MPWRPGTTVGEARQTLAKFLQETECTVICANCPVYPEDNAGCCLGCPKLRLATKTEPGGCREPNLSCLSYLCGVLIEHLSRLSKLDEFSGLTYGLPREGYRGSQRREEREVLQISDPLASCWWQRAQDSSFSAPQVEEEKAHE